MRSFKSKKHNIVYLVQITNKDPEKIRKTAESNTGKRRSKETKQLISLSKRTKVWHTPYGVFDTGSLFVSATSLSEGLLRNRCVNNVDKIIKLSDMNRSFDLSNQEKLQHVGKTWRQMGWFSEDKPND